jgi:hypothetical protein
MTKKSIHCSHVGLGRTTALRAQGRPRFNGVTSSGRCGPGEDNSAVAPGTAQVIGVMGSGRTMLLRARERRHGLGDKAKVVDDITGSGQGRWQRVRASTVARNDGTEAPGRTQRWRGGFGEDLTMARALRKLMMARAPMKFLAGNFGRLTA